MIQISTFYRSGLLYPIFCDLSSIYFENSQKISMEGLRFPCRFHGNDQAARSAGRGACLPPRGKVPRSGGRGGDEGPPPDRSGRFAGQGIGTGNAKSIVINENCSAGYQPAQCRSVSQWRLIAAATACCFHIVMNENRSAGYQPAQCRSVSQWRLIAAATACCFHNNDEAESFPRPRPLVPGALNAAGFMAADSRRYGLLFS